MFSTGWAASAPRSENHKIRRKICRITESLITLKKQLKAENSSAGYQIKRTAMSNHKGHKARGISCGKNGKSSKRKTKGARSSQRRGRWNFKLIFFGKSSSKYKGCAHSRCQLGPVTECEVKNQRKIIKKPSKTGGTKVTTFNQCRDNFLLTRQWVMRRPNKARMLNTRSGAQKTFLGLVSNTRSSCASPTAALPLASWAPANCSIRWSGKN